MQTNCKDLVWKIKNYSLFQRTKTPTFIILFTVFVNLFYRIRYIIIMAIITVTYWAAPWRNHCHRIIRKGHSVRAKPGDFTSRPLSLAHHPLVCRGHSEWKSTPILSITVSWEYWRATQRALS